MRGGTPTEVVCGCGRSFPSGAAPGRCPGCGAVLNAADAAAPGPRLDRLEREIERLRRAGRIKTCVVAALAACVAYLLFYSYGEDQIVQRIASDVLRLELAVFKRPMPPAD